MEGLSPSERWRVFRGILPSPVTANAVEDFARNFGELSRRDSGIGAWLVKPRKAAGTYSEIKGPAGFHTDSQYHHQPERLFVLACHTAAEEGGENLLLSVDDAREIAQNSLGDDAVARMQQSVWRWAVPEVFQSATVPAVSPPSAIFREDGTIRWRIDNLVCETDADQLLAEIFEQALEGSSRSENVRLLPGDVLVCDNWYSLHARTDFSDHNRVLFRARLV